ncbi:SDR family NAD(P)-dependent oxidoreductase [Sphingobium vermicomposti]|uniref:NAD(P)-dependent dehydrogenase (Short-subunit alcohol dehydrogenase family) n=1 Tax=Sphingobium vermicomposti TaxID=529005 RepID=A0A846M880_9SPHN|nr:SDR family oxidoreductase [Sphingobium vermicomposti]NIJ18049.1 NAD(P)-dependent dehydrogenase (short-subunit alcohol dehydrogenase family) [Sphingobium vermicomposti]
MSRLFPEGAVAVFGGSGGIGKGVALEFARAGTDVAIFYRSKQQVAEAAAAEIQAMGRSATIHQADARNYEEMEAAFADALESHGRIHSIVWGAGPVVAQVNIADWTLDQFRASMEIEAFGFYHAARIAIPHFRAKGGGSFVHLGSAGHDWWPHLDGLSVAPKACNESLVKGIAKEEGVNEIRANSILVGVIDAGQFKVGQQEGYFDENWEREVKKLLPIKRWGKAEDIGKTAVFLASNDANYITGQTLSVAGGFGV